MELGRTYQSVDGEERSGHWCSAQLWAGPFWDSFLCISEDESVKYVFYFRANGLSVWACLLHSWAITTSNGGTRRERLRT